MAQEKLIIEKSNEKVISVLHVPAILYQIDFGSISEKLASQGLKI